jgi:hypothetical protein
MPSVALGTGATRLGTESFKDSKRVRSFPSRRLLDLTIPAGHCLVTIGTGKASSVDFGVAGLVPTHNYAVVSEYYPPRNRSMSD